MAIYRLHAQLITRSQGRSIVAASAYRAGERMVDERTGEIHDFSDKNDVVHKEILLPENAPSWMRERSKLWNAVELGEKRKDAQLAREIQLTLPRELTVSQNTELVRDFVNNEFISRGMVADVCIHNPQGEDGEQQPHAHILLSLREIKSDGFGAKVRAWNDKSLLVQWREEWANYENKHLALHGFDTRVDHRSYKDQGIDLEPQYKIGPIAAKDRLVRLADHQRIARENGLLLLEKPEIALDAITRGQSTFTHQDLARFINRHTENAEQFQQVYEKIKQSPELVFLGLDAKGRERFSSRDMLKIETSMMKGAQRLNDLKQHAITESAKEGKAIRTLSDEQALAFDYLTEAGDLKSLVGYAGTGKSYLLGAAREAWEKSGYRVQGAALSGIAALNLQDGSGIESRTLASLFYRLDKGMLQFGAKDVVVLDEAGMVGSRTMERLVREVEGAGAKLVLVGDWQQLQAIEAGAAFRALAQTHQYVELNQIRRQTMGWQVDATLDLAQGRVAQALKAYDNHNHLHRFGAQQQAREALINQWNDVRLANPKDSQIILAYTRKEVVALNDMARAQKRKDGELGEDARFTTARGERLFAVNDRVYFLKREDSLSVINGTLGTVVGVNAESGLMMVSLDAANPKERGKVVAVNTHLYPHLEHGYAATVYKAQGITVDRSYVLPCKLYDAHSTYVAMTRHRKSCDVFVSEEVFVNDNAMVNTLNRNRAKEVTLDYARMDGEFARQRAIVPDKALVAEERQQQKAAAFIDGFSRFYKELQHHRLSTSQINELSQIAHKACGQADLMNAITAISPQLPAQIEEVAKRHQRQMERSLIMDREMEL